MRKTTLAAALLASAMLSVYACGRDEGERIDEGTGREAPMEDTVQEEEVIDERGVVDDNGHDESNM